MGYSALAVQIARVGNDDHARQFIHHLDVDPEIGDVLDCIHGTPVSIYLTIELTN